MFIYTHLSRWKIKRYSIQWFIYCVVCWDFSNIGVCYKREPSLVIIVALQKLKIKSLQTPTHDTYLKGTYLNRDEFVQRTQPTPRDFSSASQHSHLLFKDKCKNIFILSDVKKYLLKTIFLGWTKIYTYTSQEAYKAAAIYYASIVAWRTEVIHCIARLWGPPCLRRGPSEAPTVCVCVWRRSRMSGPATDINCRAQSLSRWRARAAGRSSAGRTSNTGHRRPRSGGAGPGTQGLGVREQSTPTTTGLSNLWMYAAILYCVCLSIKCVC